MPKTLPLEAKYANTSASSRPRHPQPHKPPSIRSSGHGDLDLLGGAVVAQ
jgi:hypothetical protein